MITVYINLGDNVWLPMPAYSLQQAQRIAGRWPRSQIWKDLLQVR